MVKTISLDFDDFSVLNNRLDLLLQLKEHFPNLKVSMFMIPFDPRFEFNTQAKLHRDKTLAEIKKHLDWIQLIPHGLMHLEREFEKVTYYEMRDLHIPAIKEAFDRDGLPFEKGFKAPYWLWNEDVVRALDEAGWWGAVDRNQPNMPTPKRFYRYSHSIAEPFWESDSEVLKLHGHIDGQSDNDIERCILHLMKMPGDTHFVFASEFVEEKR